jgi:hypothetical protein
LLLKRTLYGTCQAAIQFWKKLCTVMVLIAAKRSKADVCLFYQWTAAGLLVYLSWVDDILIAGRKEDVLKAKRALARHFTLDEQGEMMEYVGCQIEHDRKNRWMRMTQPVMVQSFKDEFELPDEAPLLPAPPGEVLTRIAGEPLDAKQSSKYRSGTGKLMHMMKWTRHEILNRVRELSRFMAAPTSLHLARMFRVMNYVRHTAQFGNYINPGLIWDGLNRNIEFIISGRSDAEYASDPETRRSVSGGTVFLCNTVIFAFSRMQKCVTLSVTEAEFVAAVEVVQNMLFAWRVLSSMGLKVRMPMVIEVDNKGAVDLVNSWTATGRTRHIATRINFLRELKEQGLISVNWISNVGMSSDIFTKNVGGKDFYKHRDVYVREDPSVPCVEAPTTTTYPVGEGVGACSPSADSGGDIEGDPGLEQRTGSVVEHVKGADADVDVRMDVDLVGNVPGIEGSKKADTD